MALEHRSNSLEILSHTESSKSPQLIPIQSEYSITNFSENRAVVDFSLPSTTEGLIHRFSADSLPWLYDSSNFEVESPIGEENRERLVSHLVHLKNKGQNLWIKSKNLRFVTDNEASHRALDRVYSGPISGIDEYESLQWSHLMLGNLNNAMAVRNRKRVVEQVFQEEITRTFQGELNGHGMRVLSIAAGSSRPILETIAAQDALIQKRTDIRLMDASRNALLDGVSLASELKIPNEITTRRALFTKYDSYLEEGYSPNFVEIVGLLDYVDDEATIDLLSHVRDSLAENGAVLYANVAPNDEEEMLHDVIGWRPMIYRQQDEVYNLAVKAGFSQDKITAIQEPIALCNLILARK